MAGGASAADVRSILSLPGPSSASQTPGVGPSTPSSLQATAVSLGAAGTKGKKGIRPDGIPRELYALIGSGAPTLTAQLAAKPKFKAKPKLSSGGKATKWYVYVLLEHAPFAHRTKTMQTCVGIWNWCPHYALFGTYNDIILECREWREFQNAARKDDFKLSHWVKASVDPSSGVLPPRISSYHWC